MLQIGIDFGGTKIEAAALSKDGAFLSRHRRPNPGNYADAIAVVRDLIRTVESEAVMQGNVDKASIGIGTPGSVSPRTGVMRNANSTWLNGKHFKEDLEAVTGVGGRLGALHDGILQTGLSGECVPSSCQSVSFSLA